MKRRGGGGVLASELGLGALAAGKGDFRSRAEEKRAQMEANADLRADAKAVQPGRRREGKGRGAAKPAPGEGSGPDAAPPAVGIEAGGGKTASYKDLSAARRAAKLQVKRWADL